FFDENRFQAEASRVHAIHNSLHDRHADVEGYKGWVHLPRTYDREEFTKMKRVANNIQNDSDVLLVIGVGGSYLGARAAIEMLHHNFRDLLCEEARKTPHIIFVGHN